MHKCIHTYIHAYIHAMRDDATALDEASPKDAFHALAGPAEPRDALPGPARPARAGFPVGGVGARARPLNPFTFHTFSAKAPLVHARER